MKIVDFKRLLRYFDRNRIWKIIVSFSIIFLVVIFLFNIYIFWSLEKEISSPAAPNFTTYTLKRDLLKNVLDNLKEREKKFNQGKIMPDIGDPSL